MLAVLFALVYFGAAELGYTLSLGPSVGGTFWPPSGIALAAFLVAPLRLWPALLIAGVVANYASDLIHGQTWLASVGFAIANLGEPAIGALILQRLSAQPVRFMRVNDMLALAAVVLFVSAPLAAAVGGLTAQWQTENPPGFLEGWRTWWVGDAVGALVLTPLTVRFITSFRRMGDVALRTWLEAAAFGVVVVAVTQFVFTASSTSIALPFLVFPVLIWGSLRFGPIGVGMALLAIVLLTTHDTVSGQGPFAAEHLSLGERLVALQTYVGVMAVSFHSLALLWEERTRAAAALRVAHAGLEARFKPIVEQSPFAIAAIGPDGRIREANPAWRRLWGPSEGTLRKDEEPSLGRAGLDTFLARALAGEIVELPARAVEARGNAGTELRHVRGFAYPVKDESGRVPEIVIIERDITEDLAAERQLVAANEGLREREEELSRVLAQMAEAQAHREHLLEAERVARAEAERASQLKDEFLATLSHELRTPLNAIVGWAQILRRGVNEQTLAQGIETIERNAFAQAKLIDDLLDMSRILAGKIGLVLARVPVSDIVTAAADALQPAAAAKDVTLAADVEAAAHAFVSGDEARLQQVVSNLLHNAIKFTPRGGRIDVVLDVRDVEIRLVVRDTGQGIAPEFMPAVFERFRQADGTITRRHGGLGLGLSITKQIVEMHGGTIAAESAGPERGATFTVTLPLAAESATESAAEDPAAREGGQDTSLAGLRVLVVDDEADARELLRRLLAEQACEVTLASSAVEALEQLAQGPCDVMLTDIGMPGGDGYDLLRRVRAGSYIQPRAIAVTAFARAEDRDRAFEAGFDAHLSKPVNALQLLRTMGQLATASRVANTH